MKADTVTLKLADLPINTPNSRSGHWRQRHEAQKAWREVTAWVAKAACVEPCERASVTLWGMPPDYRTRDVDGWAPALKGCLDGLRDAGVLEDDDWTRVPDVSIRVVEPDGSKRWGWWLEIAEVD